MNLETRQGGEVVAESTGASLQATLRDQVTRAVLIMTEGALRWQAGSPQVMIEQLDAIAAAAERPNVDVGIIPYTTPVTVFPRHGFHLYDSDAVIIGTETGTATITDNEDERRRTARRASAHAIDAGPGACPGAAAMSSGRAARLS